MGIFSDFFDDVFDDFLGVDPSGGGIFDIIPGGQDLFEALRAAGLFEEGSGARQGLGALLGSVALNQLGLQDPKIPQTGYGGAIPDYRAMRQQVPVATGIEQVNQTVRPMGTPAGDVASTGRVLPLMYDPNRRPGSGGRRYFTDIQYVPTGRDMGEDTAIDNAGIAAAQTQQDQQAYDLLRRNLSNLAREERSQRVGALPLMAGPIPERPQGPQESQDPEPTDPPVGQLPPDDDETQQVNEGAGGTAGGGGRTGRNPEDEIAQMAQGGIAALKSGKYLDGSTDGMADEIPATINGTQPAALSDGEFVIPADVVSHLGNGNSDAGARVLEQMMARVRKERTGNKEQGKEIQARRMLPA
jgi:hypothetical protein